MASKSFENPLLSHARMRGLYRGLVELRALRLVPRGFEACLVAACIGLQDADFVFSTPGAKAATYIRALGARTGSGAPRAGVLRRDLAQAEDRFAGTASEALLCAAGAAKAFGSGQTGGVAVALIGGKAEPEASWVRVLRMTGAAELPLVVLALPTAGATDWIAAGRRASVPVIPVDASDTVALYRVVQESVGRARADRRGAVIECVASKADPVRMMGEQLQAKGIANARWIQSVGEQFAEMLAQGS